MALTKPLASYKDPGDFGASLTANVVGQDAQGDLIIELEIDSGVGEVIAIELTKWRFNQFISEVFEQLQKV